MDLNDCFISVACGTQVNLRAVTPDDFTLRNVAQGLAHKCRFGGFTTPFYSVAQHCVLVSHLCEEQYALQALLHELDEVFLPDIPRPLKNLFPAAWHSLARDHFITGCRAFGVPHDLPEAVHTADRVALFIEADNFMSKRLALSILQNTDNATGYFRVDVTPLSPPKAYELFIHRFQELTDGHTPSRLSN